MALEEQLIDLKVHLNLKGQILLNTWTELTSLLDTYQAKLAVKEIQAKVRYEHTSQKDADNLRSEMTELKTELARTQNEVQEKDNMIFKFKTDLARLQSKLIVTQQKLEACHESSNHRMDLTVTPHATSQGVKIKVENDEEQSGKNGNIFQVLII
jgi:predicted  nucleic acid-binding Zn-ribbon protein